jgi:hypothetical protein
MFSSALLELRNPSVCHILESFYGKNHPETASVMTLAARSLVAQNKFAEAAGMLRDALGVEQQLYKGPHPASPPL